MALVDADIQARQRRGEHSGGVGTSPGSGGVKVLDRVGSEGRLKFLTLSVSRQPPLPRGRYEALVSDMAAWSRGEESGDALLGYEM